MLDFSYMLSWVAGCKTWLRNNKKIQLGTKTALFFLRFVVELSGETLRPLWPHRGLNDAALGTQPCVLAVSLCKAEFTHLGGREQYFSGR